MCNQYTTQKLLDNEFTAKLEWFNLSETLIYFIRLYSIEAYKTKTILLFNPD